MAIFAQRVSAMEDGLQFLYAGKTPEVWEKIMRDLVEKSRMSMGRKAEPSYALIDSQSAKTTDKAEARGIDGGKKNQG